MQYILPVHNFGQNNPLDKAVYSFYLAKVQGLSSTIQTNKKRYEKTFTWLIDIVKEREEVRKEFENIRAYLGTLSEIAQDNLDTAVKALALDVKLSLLAELLTTDEEKKIIRALGVLPDHRELKDPDLQSAIQNALESSFFQAEVRELFSKVVAKLKAWVKS